MTVSIVLADDHPVVRQGLCKVLEGHPELCVVGEAGDGLVTVQLVERLHPNVLVVDLMMPGLNGFEVVCEVKKRYPRTGIVVLSMHADEGYVLEALRAGVSAYVLKESSPDDLVCVVLEVVAGRRYLSAPLSERAIEAYASRNYAEARLDVYETLTTREREVLQLIAEGHTNKAIAERLAVSLRTVETHRTHLMRKLGLKSLGELIRYALERGLCK